MALGRVQASVSALRGAPERRGGRTRRSWARRSRRAGATLIEVMVAIGLVVLLTGGAFFGLGMLESARLRESTTLIAGAIKSGYNHANATSRVTRLVFDFEARTVTLEESEGVMLLKSGDITGGAAAATELEQAVLSETQEILEGPRAPRPQFRPVKSLGFDLVADARRDQDQPTGKELPRGVTYREIEVSHDESPITSGRAYLYFWPGGQTERAAIQLQLGDRAVDDKDVLTLLVKPLTGDISVERGPVAMPRPMTDAEASEYDDP